MGSDGKPLVFCHPASCLGFLCPRTTPVWGSEFNYGVFPDSLFHSYPFCVLYCCLLKWTLKSFKANSINPAYPLIKHRMCCLLRIWRYCIFMLQTTSNCPRASRTDKPPMVPTLSRRPLGPTVLEALALLGLWTFQSGHPAHVLQSRQPQRKNKGPGSACSSRNVCK